MNLFGPTRNAQEFAAAVDSGRESADPKLRRLGAVAELVRVAAPAPDADFRLSLRRQLMAAAQTELIPAQRRPVEQRVERAVTPSVPTRLGRRLSALAAGALVAGSSISVVAASANALPGELLYPVKRAAEDVELLLRSDLATEGQLQLEHAAHRLDEVDALIRSPQAGSVENTLLISTTLEDFTVQADEGADDLIAAFQQNEEPGTIEELNGFTTQTARQLSQLAGVMPAGVGQEFADAADMVVELAARTSDACASCPVIDEIELESLLATTEGTVDDATPPVTVADPIPADETVGRTGDGGRNDIAQQGRGDRSRNGAAPQPPVQPESPVVTPEPGTNQNNQPGGDPVGEQPVDDGPVGDAPVEEQPVDDGPVGEQPVGDAPVGDAPVEEQPVDDGPVGDNPVGDNPVGDNPVGDNPVGDNPVGDNPVGDNPVGDNPVGDNPVGDNPVGDNPVGDNPVGEGPVVPGTPPQNPVPPDVPTTGVPGVGGAGNGAGAGGAAPGGDDAPEDPGGEVIP